MAPVLRRILIFAELPVSSRLPTLLSSVAAVALACASPALAQDVTEVQEVVVTGSQVSVPPAYAGGQVAAGGRVGLFGAMDFMDTPFNTTSYTADLSLNQQALGVGDVLQNAPAVSVSKGFGNFQELYVIRGFPVYSDDMAYNGLYGVLPRQFVAAELLERVEVLYGASAFLNGAAPGGSGVGGAINLMPKRAPRGPLTRLTAGWAGDDEIYGAADLARRLGDNDDYGVRLNLAGRSGQGGVDNQGVDLRVVGLGLDGRGDRVRFSADLGWQDHHIDAPRPTVTPAGAVPTPPSAGTNYAQPWTYTDERQLFGAVRGEFDVTDSVSLWAAFGGRDGREANVLANPTAAPDGTLTAYRFDNAREDSVWSGDIGVRAELTTGAVEHTLVASAAHVESDSRNAYAFSSFAGFAGDLYDPFPVAAPTPDFFIGGDLDAPLVTESVSNTSFAVADRLSFLDGRLMATVGARYQEIETRTFDYNTGAQNDGYDGDAVTPAFALVWRPTSSISLYANYAEALQPGEIAPAVVNGVLVANAGEVLDPFRAEQVEAGVKYDGGPFGGTLSVFRITRPVESFDPATRLYGADGEQEHRGVELSLFGEPVDGLRLLGGAAWIDAETDSGAAPIGVPEFRATLNAEWDVAATGLTLEGRVVHAGEQAVSADNTVMLEDWTRFDAGVRYAFEAGGKPVTLRARVENLADEDHWVAVGGFPNANYLTLGAPRTLRLSLSTDF
jgi:iron complex outermembrane recepter protein